MDNEQQSFKHFCRICKKGFMCGRALGGHMRTHVLGDEASNLDDDDEEDGTSDWEDKVDMDAPLINQRNYALRTNPNRLKSCRICENCGVEFLCWKSFLEHRKCNSEDVEGEDQSRGCKWSKRKRSFRVNIENVSGTNSLNEDDDMAAMCLVMLSNARVEQVDQPEESCASASREDPEAVMAFFSSAVFAMETKAKTIVTKTGLFECKACKKVFNSHQALGGHRASHKKVKGCFAARLDTEDSDNLLPTKSLFDESGPSSPVGSNPWKRKSKVHECSICHRIFSSGQALGGHKRCHWLTSNSQDIAAKFNPFNQNSDNSSYKPEGLCLNLNLLPAPAIEEGIGVIRRDPFSNFDQFRDEKDNSKKMKEEEEEEEENNKIVDQEDEAESKVMKLKSINVGGTSSRWLQVGIGSATADDHNAAAAKPPPPELTHHQPPL